MPEINILYLISYIIYLTLQVCMVMVQRYNLSNTKYICASLWTDVNVILDVIG